MAEVYLAREAAGPHAGRIVVVKRMHAHLAADERYIAMFRREARVAARLDHPNIVRLFEIGDDGGTPFIAMEHIDGVTLHRLARCAWQQERALPTEVIVQAIADAALGLHHAHTLLDESGQSIGLIHRDVSPDNLMVTRSGVTKVLDFGIARGVDKGQTLTETGELKGKIPYMSPEQVEGKLLDARSDLFSLGVTLYWLLCGRRPFDGPSEVATIRLVAEAKAVRALLVNARVPPSLDLIVMRLLAKKPAARYPDGKALHDDLIRLLGRHASDRTALTELIASVVDEDAGPNERTDVLDVTTAFASQPATATFATTPSPMHLTRPSRRSAALGAAAAVVCCVGAAFSQSEGPSTSSNMPLVTETPAPPSVTLRLSAAPPHAAIRLDGVDLDANPATVVRAQDHVGHDVRVEAPGFTPERFSITFASDSERHIELKPEAAPRVPPLPPSPAPMASKPPPTATRAKAPQAQSVNCSPPYVIESDGLKTYKPECL